MMQTVNTRWPKEVPNVRVKGCPFCGTFPYWMEAEHLVSVTIPNGAGLKSDWRLHFYHPGVATDKDCLLCGKGFSMDELEKWNTRVES